MWRNVTSDISYPDDEFVEPLSICAPLKGQLFLRTVMAITDGRKSNLVWVEWLDSPIVVMPHFYCEFQERLTLSPV